jgi:hypothetical protein
MALPPGRSVRARNPTAKLTINNLEAPLLTSHRESIAAADARKAQLLHLSQPPAPLPAPPPTTAPPLTLDSCPPSQALSTTSSSTKRPFEATVVDADQDDKSDESSEASVTPQNPKKRKKKRARKQPGKQNKHNAFLSDIDSPILS